MTTKDERRIVRAADREIARVDELLTVAQASADSGFSQVTIRRHIAKGALPVVLWGPHRRIRIKKDDFARYLLSPPDDSFVVRSGQP